MHSLWFFSRGFLPLPFPPEFNVQFDGKVLQVSLTTHICVSVTHALLKGVATYYVCSMLLKMPGYGKWYKLQNESRLFGFFRKFRFAIALLTGPDLRVCKIGKRRPHDPDPSNWLGRHEKFTRLLHEVSPYYFKGFRILDCAITTTVTLHLTQISERYAFSLIHWCDARDHVYGFEWAFTFTTCEATPSTSSFVHTVQWKRRRRVKKMLLKMHLHIRSFGWVHCVERVSFAWPWSVNTSFSFRQNSIYGQLDTEEFIINPIYVCF